MNHSTVKQLKVGIIFVVMTEKYDEASHPIEGDEQDDYGSEGDKTSNPTGTIFVILFYSRVHTLDTFHGI